MQDHCCRLFKKSSMLFIFIVTLFDFHSLIYAEELTAVVNTTTGPVQGIISETVHSVPYAAFKGIPFAEPPVGYNRFKPPIPIKPWTTTLNATADGPKCIQASMPLGSQTTGSEDCLTLSVYTTETDLSEAPDELKPVMAWIYGGGYSYGTSQELLYSPDYLLEKGVLYVTFNYRLGALGFLSLNHRNASGNAGLKDQLLALKWVKENIAQFGGNPNNVTIFGQSAGAASVGFHVLSEASEGYFHGAISMSGAPMCPWALHSPGEALSRAIWLGSLLGTNTIDKEKLLETFYSATADDITIATAKLTWTLLPFAPTIENEKIALEPFLTKCSVDKYRSGNFNKVPQIMGFTDDETVTFGVVLQPLVSLANEAAFFANIIGFSLPTNLAVISDLIEKKTDLGYGLFNSSLYGFVRETTDLLFIAQIDQTQRYLSTKNDGKPIFYYHTSYFTNESIHNVITNTTVLGPGHADDLAYIFYYPNMLNSWDEPTRNNIERVSTMWTNFAKYGDPTPSWIPEASVGIKWPDSGIFGRSLDIGRELSVGPRPTNTNVKLFQAATRRKLRSINGCFSPLLL